MRGWMFAPLALSVFAFVTGCNTTTDGSGIPVAEGSINGSTSRDASADAPTDAGGTVLPPLIDAGSPLADAGQACVLDPSISSGDLNCHLCLQTSCCGVTNACFSTDGGHLENFCAALGTCLSACANGTEPGDGGTFDAAIADGGPIADCNNRCEAAVPPSAQSAYTQFVSCFAASCATHCPVGP